MAAKLSERPWKIWAWEMCLARSGILMFIMYRKKKCNTSATQVSMDQMMSANDL